MCSASRRTPKLDSLARFLAVTLFAAGCLPAGQLKATSSSEYQERTGDQGLTLNELRNATYRGIYDIPVTLKNGKYEGLPFQRGGAARSQVILVGDRVARGDLNGDGVDEAVVLLAENSGGSGTRNYLAVVAVRESRPVNVATELLGDRVQLRSMRVENERLIVDTVAHGAADAVCCPTLKVQRAFVLDRNRLSEVNREESGTISAADLEGVNWVLQGFGSGERAAPESPITLEFEAGRIAGSAGCNEYFAAYESGAPGQLKMGTPGTTRKACAPSIMAQEASYLNALKGVTSYGFLGGDLELTYQQDGSFGTLLFAPRRP